MNGPIVLPLTDPGALLAGAEAPRSNPDESAAAIERALQTAPQDPEIRISAYRFYFYNHDFDAALAQAEALLVLAAQRLNIPRDWRAVAPTDADFVAAEFAPGLYLQALVAIGYCQARCGNRDLAKEVLGKTVQLDPKDRFSGGWLLAQIEAAEEDDDEF